MSICPNKNHPDWIKLVEDLGEDLAYFVWSVTDGNPDRFDFTELAQRSVTTEAISDADLINKMISKLKNLYPKIKLIRKENPEFETEKVYNQEDSVINSIDTDKIKDGQLKKKLDIDASLVLPVFKKLEELGHKALIVGGSVRDALLGKVPKDIDIEVYGLSIDELKSILEEFGKVDEVGKAFGILKFYPYKPGTTELQKIEEPFDFSVPRRENKVGKGHKGFSVEFDRNITIKEAASRRDFTWNSLAYDPVNEIIYDYYDGIKHLKEGYIRHTSQQFEEDPLRVLRAMQFQSRMGLILHPDTTALIKKMVDEGMMDDLAKERIAEEWMKWAIKGTNPQLIFDFLRDTGLGNKYFPELMALRETPQDPEFHPEGNVEIHTKLVLEWANIIAKQEKLNSEEKAVLIFSALFHDIAKPLTTKIEYDKKRGREVVKSPGHEEAGGELVRDILSRMKIKKDIINKVSGIISHHLYHVHISHLPEKSKFKVLNKLLEGLGGASFQQLINLIKADSLGRAEAGEIPESLNKLIELYNKYKEIFGETYTPIISGADLVKLGIKPGPEFKVILEKLKQEHLEGKVNKDNVKERALQLYKSLPKNQETGGKIIGQANIEAMTVLIDLANEKIDTIPHEYAHHFIEWFEDTPIVQEAIKKWGDKESLVQAIGEQAVKQQGEAWGWWKTFINWLKTKLNLISSISKEGLKNILTDAFLMGVNPMTGERITPEMSVELAKKSDQGIYNQLLTKEDTTEQIEKITKEHHSILALKKLGYKLADRIGGKITFINDPNYKWKGYNHGNTSVINLAYATPDTPFHEILAHPIIRVIKKEKPELYKSLLKELETGIGKEIFEKVKKTYKYKNNYKIIDYFGSYAIAKIADLDAIIRDEEGRIKYFDHLEEAKEELKKYNTPYTLEEQQEEALVTLLGLMSSERFKYLTELEENSSVFSKLKTLLKEFIEYVKNLLKKEYIEIKNLDENTTLSQLADMMGYGNNYIILPGYKMEYVTPLGNKYDTIEEVNEEIRNIIELSEKNNLKIEDILNGNFDLNRSSNLIEEKIQKLESKIAHLKNVMNSKKYKDYKERKIKKLIQKLNYFKKKINEFYKKSNIDEDELEDTYINRDVLIKNRKTSHITGGMIGSTYKKDKFYYKEDLGADYEGYFLYSSFNSYYTGELVIEFAIPLTKEEAEKFFRTQKENELLYEIDSTRSQISYLKNDIRIKELIEKLSVKIDDLKFSKNKLGIIGFLIKNIEFNFTEKVIERWKSVNEIVYDPEEVYSRGQEFYHIHNAYASNHVDTVLWIQNLLQLIEDKAKLGSFVEMSFATAPKGEVGKGLSFTKKYTNDYIYITAYPNPEDIKFASRIDNWTSSFSYLNDRIISLFTKERNERVGIALTKSVPLRQLKTIASNLATIIDNVAHHNEVIIRLTPYNFRIFYKENTPYELKKLIDNFNRYLDQKYGELKIPEIRKLSPKPPVKTRKNTTDIFSIVKELKKESTIEFNDGKDSFKIIFTHNNKFSYLINNNNVDPETFWETVSVNKNALKALDKQLLINAALGLIKEIEKKYPRSLIVSRVVPIDEALSIDEEINFSKLDDEADNIDEFDNINIDESLIESIIKNEVTYTNEENELCAAAGLTTSKFTKGTKWKVVKDLKGYPSHAQGGVDIKIGKDGVSFIKNGGEIKAASGLILPAVKSEKNLTVSELYKQKTGKEWSTAKESGLTDGSYENNMKLKQKLLSGEFDNNQTTNIKQNFNNQNNQNQDYSQAKSFKEAFKIARQQLGPNQIFEYQGRKYGTNLEGEEFKPSEEVLKKHNMNNPEVKERLETQNKMVLSVYSDKKTTKLEPEYQDWEKIKKRNAERNKMEEADKIITYKKENNDGKNYAIVDKKKGLLHIYKPGEDFPIFTSAIDLGANIGDAQTVTKVKDSNNDGIIDKKEAKTGTADFNLGNKTTGAGRYYISNKDLNNKQYGGISLNLMNESQYELYKKTGKINNVATSFHTGYVKDNRHRVSNGCIRCNTTTLENLNKYLDLGSEVYILPEDEGNSFVFENGKLNFRVNSKNNYAEYKDSYGNIQKGQGINKSINTLNYKPIKLELDEKLFKEKVFTLLDFNDEKEFNTTKIFIEALQNSKKKIMEVTKINGDVYNDIAKIAFGIYGTESNYGDTHSALGNLVRAARKVNIQQTIYNKLHGDEKIAVNPDVGKPDVYSSATTYRQNTENDSYGLTQLKWKNLNQREKEVLKELGITSHTQLLQPDKAAIATAAILAVRYQEQLSPEKRKDIETYLPTTWNKRNNYSERVIKNSQYLKIKELN